MYALSGDAPPDVVPRLFQERAPSGRVLDSMPQPDTLPAWLGPEDLDRYAQAYARTGFRGPLGVYRNQDRDWHQHPAYRKAFDRLLLDFLPGILHRNALGGFGENADLIRKNFGEAPGNGE